MRKDKGLNGDLDRLPMLTWIMFLKFLDDLELQREGEAKLATKKFRPAIEPPYRWHDWAAQSDGITGDELLAFINNEEATRPDGKRGAGLFRYLRTLTNSNGDDRREVIATVFRGVQNRMVSGYLLRDVINKISAIHFTSSSELHTLGALYESMLREMRDAAGDSGEFYTPRAVVRFMVTVTNPRLGETVLDPASGTGGFLVESFNHLSQQVKTVADRKILQTQSLFGCEPKTLPYLLCQMNLLLHGLDAPQIDPGNSLRFKLTDIGERDCVDVILTNPPFGGEEEKGIQGNFPEDKQTAETAMLFLQLIMRKLRRQPHPERGCVQSTTRSTLSTKGASGLSKDSVASGAAAAGLSDTAALLYSRAAVVVPNGTLFGDGVCARIKEELLKEFNLHTIVRLPEGVFAPYTGIETNLLFFDRSGPTRGIWYYEHGLPEGRKSYTKTQPLRFEEFSECLEWWSDRKENDHAWSVPVQQVIDNGYDLDIRNPRGKDKLAHLPPNQLSKSISSKEKQAVSLMEEIGFSLEQPVKAKVKLVALSEIARLVTRPTKVVAGTNYRTIGVKWWGEGAYERETIDGSETAAKTLSIVREGDLIINKIWVRHGSTAVAASAVDGCAASGEFPTFELDAEKVLGRWIHWQTKTRLFWKKCSDLSRGTSGKNRIKPELFLTIKIPLPELEDQKRIVAILEKLHEAKRLHMEINAEMDALLPSILDRAAGGNV